MCESDQNSQIDLTNKFQEILEENGIHHKISKLTVSGADLKGEHMASVIELVRLEFEGSEVEPMDLFVKKKLPTEGMDPLMAVEMTKMVTMEGFFLKDFNKELKDLCMERIGSTDLMDNLVPHVFYYDEDMIVMENLIKQGYKTLPKVDRQDFEHAKLVLENLARLHGVGHVLIEKEGGIESFLKKRPDFVEPFLDEGMMDFFSKMFEPTFALNNEIVKKSSHPEKERIYDILQKYQGRVTDLIKSAIGSQTLFSVINHPDCWNNNMMFHGPGPNHHKLIFVDFQMMRANSPNLDISYFIFTSTKPEVRRRWRELLKIYLDKLREIVESLGQPFPFKFEDFVEDFIRKSKLGFLFGIIMLVGVEAIGAHDADAGDGLAEDVFTKLMVKWIEENPTKTEKVAGAIISFVNDYLLFAEL